MTKLNNGENFDANNRGGHNINWGIREFGMCAQNGMLLHGGVRVISAHSSFYRLYEPAVSWRCKSLPAIYLLSHDSIAVAKMVQPINLLNIGDVAFNSKYGCHSSADEKETYRAGLSL